MNTSVLPLEKRKTHLLKIETPKVWWGYGPVISALPKLLLTRGELFGDLPPDNPEQLYAAVRKSCKSGTDQQEACVSVAKAIHEWVVEKEAFGRAVAIDPLRTTADSLKYCADVVLILKGQIHVLNVQPRSVMTYSSEGKELMKSLIHHTALIGDLRTARPSILQTPKQSDGTRKAILETLEGRPRYSLQEIIKRVNETYAIWETILRSRVTGDASSGPGND